MVVQLELELLYLLLKQLLIVEGGREGVLKTKLQGEGGTHDGRAFSDVLI